MSRFVIGSVILVVMVSALAVVAQGIDTWVVVEKTTYPYRELVPQIEEIGGLVNGWAGAAVVAAGPSPYALPLKIIRIGVALGTKAAAAYANDTSHTSVSFVSVPRGIVASGTQESQQYQRDLHQNYTSWQGDYRRYRKYNH